ncbi:MAG: VWA domain-containing protein [Terriglobia bacterium]
MTGRINFERIRCLLLTVIVIVAEGFCLQIAAAQAQTPEATAAAAPAQGSPYGQSGFALRIQRNEVLVDVRVTGRNGRPITDLKPSDFKLYEDGVLQQVNSFDLENVEQLATAQRGTAPPAVINLSKLPRNASPQTLNRIVQNHRMITLFFDLTSMPEDDLMRAMKSATGFVRAQMTPADLVAIVTYSSGLRVVQDFTNDRDALDKAINSIAVGESSSLSQAGAEGAAGGADESGNAIVNQDLSGAFTPDETEFNIFNTDEKLAAVESLAEMLRAVPGRKIVIHFSSGIEQTGEDNEAQLLATIDAANRSDVSIYTIDSRGLLALPPGGDASTASPAGTAIYTSAAVTSQISSLHEARETLASLASDTGGKMFYDLNKFAPAFHAILAANSTYYLLGYSPADAATDGRYRRIRVVVDRPGAKVEARPGYYAPKSFHQYTREDKDIELQQAMNSETPFLDLPLAVQAAYFLRPDNHYDVVLAAKIPGSAIPFKGKRTSKRQTEFDFAWRATDPSGKVAAALRDTLPVKLSANAYQELLKSNVLYEGRMLLPPGSYRLKVVVRENLSGKIGTFEEPLILPPIQPKRLSLSSVVVSNQVSQRDQPVLDPFAPGRRGTRAPHDPMTVDGRAVLPSVTNVFRSNQVLYVYLQSYGGEPLPRQPGSRSSRGLAPSSFALVFFRDGAQISEAGPYLAKIQNEQPASASYFAQIPLAQFPAGRYWLQINVLDPAADRAAFTRVPLAIMGAPARHSASR